MEPDPPFADYSFNRAHSACYAYVAYQTAWLKANYPVEYMAALLTSVKDRKDDKPKYLSMARRMGIEVTLPDVNSSDMDFTPVGEQVRFGLSAVRGVGEGVVEKIIEARRKSGEFTSFHDFCRKVDPVCLNRKTLESLIKAGAFETHGHSRKGLMDVFESLRSEILERREKEDAGQFSLWGGTATGDDGGDQHRRSGDPARRVPEGAAAPVREGDARGIRLRPSSPRRRGPPRPYDRRPDLVARVALRGRELHDRWARRDPPEEDHAQRRADDRS